MSDNGTYYKLVDRNGYSRRGVSGETCWLPIGKTVKPTGKGKSACGPGVLHMYGSALEAVLYNPVHANIKSPRLLKVSASTALVNGDGLKMWTTGKVKVVAELELPEVTIEQKVAWAICLAPHSSTRLWAINWLTGKDRSREAAAAAAVGAVGAVDALPARSLAAYRRAENILAGNFPAESYDLPL